MNIEKSSGAKERQIPREMESLFKALDETNEIIDQLHEHLEPVLSSDEPVEKDEDFDESGLCAVAQKIRRAKVIVDTIRKKSLNGLQRLQA